MNGRNASKDRKSGSKRGKVTPSSRQRTDEQFRIAVGQQIKHLRESRRWTTSKLAESVGGQVNDLQIRKIEAGLANISLEQAKALAEALEVGIEEFFGKAPEVVNTPSEKYLPEFEAIKEGTKEVKRVGNQHQKALDAKYYRYWPLQGDDAISKQPWLLQAYAFEVGNFTRKDGTTVSAPEDFDDWLDSHSGEEVVICLSGNVEFIFEQVVDDAKHTRVIRLKTGDCLHYSSHTRHGYRAISANPHLIFVLFDPDRIQRIHVRPKQGE